MWGCITLNWVEAPQKQHQFLFCSYYYLCSSSVVRFVCSWSWQNAFDWGSSLSFNRRMLFFHLDHRRGRIGVVATNQPGNNNNNCYCSSYYFGTFAEMGTHRQTFSGGSATMKKSRIKIARLIMIRQRYCFACTLHNLLIVLSVVQEESLWK